MKIILIGEAQKRPQTIGILTEEMLLDPKIANEKLSLNNLKIEKIEIVNGEKVVYITENKNNILLG